MKGFKPVQFDFGQIHVRGGHVSKSSPMTSKTVRGEGGRDQTFVKLAVTEMWLIQATTGQTKYTQSSFGRTSLLTALHSSVEKFCDGELSVARGAHEVDVQGEDYDPMAEVEASPPANTKVPGNGNKRTRYYKNHCKKTCVTLQMPERCPEQDPKCTELRTIKLFIEDRKQIWLHLDDVEWAVKYLYAQNMLKGVPLVSPDSAGPGGA